MTKMTPQFPSFGDSLWFCLYSIAINMKLAYFVYKSSLVLFWVPWASSKCIMVRCDTATASNINTKNSHNFLFFLLLSICYNTLPVVWMSESTNAFFSCFHRLLWSGFVLTCVHQRKILCWWNRPSNHNKKMMNTVQKSYPHQKDQEATKTRKPLQMSISFGKNLLSFCCQTTHTVWFKEKLLLCYK